MPIEAIEPRRLYRQIADQLRQLIDNGEYPAGSRLPTERALADLLGVSRPTVREALIVLEVEGSAFRSGDAETELQGRRILACRLARSVRLPSARRHGARSGLPHRVPACQGERDGGLDRRRIQSRAPARIRIRRRPVRSDERSACARGTGCPAGVLRYGDPRAAADRRGDPLDLVAPSAAYRTRSSARCAAGARLGADRSALSPRTRRGAAPTTS